jgi:hypothetical protein
MVSTQPDGTPDPGPLTAVDPRRPVFQPMSIRGPALVVLGIAVFIVVVGVVASAVDSGGAPTLSVHSVTIPDGTTVQLTPATTAMKGIISAGEPPADILGNMAVPSGSTVVRTVDTDQNLTQFDRTVHFTIGLASGQVVDLYRALLPRLGWSVIYAGSGASRSASGTEVLAKKGSGDGFYWEAGVVVSPTAASGATPYSVELFELPDDN